ncbi:hypothetical protein TPY_3216 [Sulfobacillus acidophilus TPY]|uniref:Uncharacterized protein n=1 Tax=Sulfobacillus acidophilus (strain ATCC 700253 / DSM 10332 / NAL) TaxID=679936 RepID=G8TZF3_SULAD|nr:hypothetical protein TPY_3216 [Sulfobacillus acidophilus TPY]AEW05193.1 hypothetical protein Sulac_1697 [Sulfobacillus acidophilus DSM 10332]
MLWVKRCTIWTCELDDDIVWADAGERIETEIIRHQDWFHGGRRDTPGRIRYWRIYGGGGKSDVSTERRALGD